MRIGLECQRLFRKKRHGIEIVSLELINALNRIQSEHDFVVFAKKDGDVNVLDNPGLISRYAYTHGSYPLWEQMVLPQAARQEKIDLLHCLCNTAPLYGSQPLIITIHDIIYLESLKNLNGTVYQNVGNLYRRFNVPLAKRRAIRVITVSEYVKQRIMDRLKLSPERVSVIHNGISSVFRVIDRNEESLQRVRKKYELPENFFLFLGNKAHKKNTAGVISGYVRYRLSTPTARPLLMVDTTDSYVDSLFNEYNLDWSVRNSISTLGYVNHEELVLLYNLASCFLYPSLREGFGLPILEAMACGTPVITSNTSSMPEIAGSAAMLVDPFSSRDVAEKLREFTEHTGLANELTDKGLRNIKKFTWDHAAECLLNTYDEVFYRERASFRKLYSAKAH